MQSIATALQHRRSFRSLRKDQLGAGEERTLFFLSVRSQSTEVLASAIAQDERWRYAGEMTRTHEKVRYSPHSKDGGYTPFTAASGVDQAFKFLEGRWNVVILFHMFGENVLRFSDLERAIPAISQKMLIQQLRQMESDGIVRRIVHHQVPPRVEYGLTDWGQALCPALDALLTWFEQLETRSVPEDSASRTT